MTDTNKDRITYAQLKAELDKLTPEQLAQEVIWSGDERGGYVRRVFVLPEDWIGDRSDGETWMPRSEWVKLSPQEVDGCDVVMKAGTVQLHVD